MDGGLYRPLTLRRRHQAIANECLGGDSRRVFVAKAQTAWREDRANRPCLRRAVRRSSAQGGRHVHSDGRGNVRRALSSKSIKSRFTRTGGVFRTIIGNWDRSSPRRSRWVNPRRSATRSLSGATSNGMEPAWWSTARSRRSPPDCAACARFVQASATPSGSKRETALSRRPRFAEARARSPPVVRRSPAAAAIPREPRMIGAVARKRGANVRARLAAAPPNKI